MPHGPVPERWANGAEWKPPHSVYDAEKYPGGVPGIVSPQRQNIGGQGRYLPHEPYDPHDERLLKYRGNQACMGFAPLPPKLSQ